MPKVILTTSNGSRLIVQVSLGLQSTYLLTKPYYLYPNLCAPLPPAVFISRDLLVLELVLLFLYPAKKAGLTKRDSVR